jgi:hypothetical protein
VDLLQAKPADFSGFDRDHGEMWSGWACLLYCTLITCEKVSTGGNLWQNLPGSQTHGNPSPFEERIAVDAALREYRELSPWRVSNRCPNLYGFILKTSHSWFIGYHFFWDIPAYRNTVVYWQFDSYIGLDNTNVDGKDWLNSKQKK